MTFRIRADATFQAESIDDAMVKLSTHFENAIDGMPSDLIETGYVKVEPQEAQA